MTGPREECSIYWGSHGCRLKRGHDGHHFCCCDCGDLHPWGVRDGDGKLELDVKCVGTYPYYGPDTNFYSMDDLRADS